LFTGDHIGKGDNLFNQKQESEYHDLNTSHHMNTSAIKEETEYQNALLMPPTRFTVQDSHGVHTYPG
jgi:hypothetical protein